MPLCDETGAMDDGIHRLAEKLIPVVAEFARENDSGPDVVIATLTNMMLFYLAASPPEFRRDAFEFLHRNLPSMQAHADMVAAKMAAAENPH